MDIRPSPLAGRWYPGDAQQLADSVDQYISKAELPEISGEVTALISPHAGHIYSGPVAGSAFKTLRGTQFNRVIILSPYHQPHSAPILTTGHDAYQTPLGSVPVDRQILVEINQQLKETAGIELTEIKRDEEHAVEILLPFFQRVLPEGFQLVPLMIRDQDPTLMRKLGDILGEQAETADTLLVASTDLSHFHPTREAQKLDHTIIDCIQAMDPEALYQAHKIGTGSACGLGPLASVIWASKNKPGVTARVLDYANSGDITGDTSSVVGYTSAVMIRD